MDENPEIGKSIVAARIRTNFHAAGSGPPVLLLHGSGPGVTAWSNWRLTIPVLGRHFRLIAPDIVGFGYTERPAQIQYNLDTWVTHVIGLLDALEIASADVIGNSFGGALALALSVRAPDRVRRLCLMGSVGVRFPLTAGLDQVWGYTPSIENMRAMLDLFAYDRSLVSDDLARMRYEASRRPGVQEAFASLFPAPRQRWLDGLASHEAQLSTLRHETLIIHGREDRVIPLAASQRLFELIPRSQLHVFGRCGHWTQIEQAARFARLVQDFYLESTVAQS